MAKQDVLDAINATIVPNNIKGITAESLNNVLTMMAENAGEGSGGDGALRVIVPDMLMLGPEIVAIGELSPASWEEMKLLLEQSGADASEYDAVVKASFEHNANVAQQILAKAKEGHGASVVLDQTPYLSAAINMELTPALEVMVEDYSICGVQPVGLYMQYMKPTPEGEAALGSELFECGFFPYDNVASEQYPSDMVIYLHLDGSLTFIPIEEEQPSSGSGVVTFYAPSGETATDEEKAKNAEAFNSYQVGSMVVVCDNASQLTMSAAQSIMNTDFIDVFVYEYTGNGAVEPIEFLFYNDGSVTIQ